MFRRLVMSAVVAAVAVLSPVAPPAHAAASSPGAVVPAEIVASQLGSMRSDLERYQEALLAGRFGMVLDTDTPRFDGLLARVDDLSQRAGDVTSDEMASVVLDAAVLLQELARRDGADPQLVAEIEFMFPAMPPGAAPDLATAPLAAPSPTAPSPSAPATTAPPVTAPATTAPATTAPPARSAPVTTSPVAATSPSAEAAAMSGTTPAADARPAAGSTGGWGVRTWMLLVMAVTAALAIATYVAGRVHRARLPKPTGRPGFHDLFDVSRRLAVAGSAEEVETTAVRQFVRLTGATGGAFVHHRDRRLSVGFETDPGLLVGERLRDGILDRVIGTGAEVLQASIVDPAVRTAPTSMIAVPVYLGGAVAGAVVVLRDPATPFSDLDLRMAADLKPIVGAAFEQVHHTQQVRAEAYTDVLTGVENRRALDVRVAALEHQFFAALMIDLDHFKAVNDTYGHAAGDDLLRSVAARITANVRPGDGVYRYGGEEFAVLMPHTEELPAWEVAERIRRAIEAAPFLIGPTRIAHHATASLGVATGVGGADVLGRADTALYAAKRSGRNRVALAPAPGAAVAPAASPV